jgi:hypothetical protein
MAAYARDFILTRSSSICSQIQKQAGDTNEIEAARERIKLLKRVPANTLSSNIAGISVAQHIDQIFQVINMSRPIVASATHADLSAGSSHTRPSTLAASPSSRHEDEAGNTKMAVA